MDKQKEMVSKLFVIVTVTYVTCLLLSNLIAGKMISVLGATLPAAVILFPLTYILGDVFTEVYGFKRTKMVIWLGFSCSFFAVLVYLATIALPYPEFWKGQEAFKTVLGITPRVFAASLIGYLFGEFSNAYILSRLKVRTKGKFLWFRTILSTLVGEAMDTIIFITVSFAGIIDKPILLQMILFQYIFKVGYEVVFTPVTYRFVSWMKHKEEIDVFDHDESYRLI